MVLIKGPLNLIKTECNVNSFLKSASRCEIVLDAALHPVGSNEADNADVDNQGCGIF